MHSLAACAIFIALLSLAVYLNQLLVFFLLLELLYVVYYAVVKKPTIQTHRPAPALTLEARRRLQAQCIATVPSPTLFVRSWFRFKRDDEIPGAHCAEGHGRNIVPLSCIGRGNVEDWIAWGFWGEVSASSVPKDEQKELQNFVDKMEAACATEVRSTPRKKNNSTTTTTTTTTTKEEEEEEEEEELNKYNGGLGKDGKFPAGRNPEIEVLKFSLEPVFCRWKPFVLFATLEVVWFLSALVLLALGFRYRAQGEVAYWIRKPGPVKHTHKESAEAHSRKQHSKGARTPVVLMHGVGLGVMPYVATIYSLLSGEGWNRPYICLESPEYPRFVVSSDMAVPFHYAECVEEILQKNGFDRANFIGHSIGTVYLTWIVHNAPHLVKDLVLVDPVCLLLHHSRVLWNFLYARPPVNVVGQLVQWVVLRDPNVSFRLRRNFTWYQNILFLGDVPETARVLVFLSEEDEYVPSKLVEEYIIGHNEKLDASEMTGLGGAGEAVLAARGELSPRADSQPQTPGERSNEAEIIWLKGGRHGCCVTNGRANKVFRRVVADFLASEETQSDSLASGSHVRARRVV